VDGDGENGTLDLDPEPICAALDYNAEWTGITEIRLVLEQCLEQHENSADETDSLEQHENSENSEPETYRRYRYEFVREAHNRQQHMVITPPSDLFYIQSAFSTDAHPPAAKTQLAQALVEQLHLRHAVVNGVDEFSV